MVLSCQIKLPLNQLSVASGSLQPQSSEANFAVSDATTAARDENVATVVSIDTRMSVTSSASGDHKQLVEQIMKATGKRDGWLLHAKMLLVVTVPIVAVIIVMLQQRRHANIIVAVIIVFGLSLNDSFYARNNALNTVADFDIFAEINVLVTGIRAERGLSTTFIVLGGHDAETTTQLSGYRKTTDTALSALTEWPTGLEIAGVNLATKSDLVATLTNIRRQVDDLLVDYNYVTDFYSLITSTFMDWLEVNDVLFCSQHNLHFVSIHNRTYFFSDVCFQREKRRLRNRKSSMQRTRIVTVSRRREYMYIYRPTDEAAGLT